MLFDQDSGTEAICLSPSQTSRENHRFLTACLLVHPHAAISWTCKSSRYLTTKQTAVSMSLIKYGVTELQKDSDRRVRGGRGEGEMAVIKQRKSNFSELGNIQEINRR